MLHHYRSYGKNDYTLTTPKTQDPYKPNLEIDFTKKITEIDLTKKQFQEKTKDPKKNQSIESILSTQ